MYRVQGADGKEYGPVTAEQIRQWIIERRLNANSLVLPEGMISWKPLGAAPEFTATLAQSTAAVPYSTPSRGINAFASTGFVCGIVAVICCCGGPFFSLLAIVFSIVALVQIRNNPGQGGKSLAIAGIVLGALAFIEFIALTIAGTFGEWIDKLR